MIAKLIVVILLQITPMPFVPIPSPTPIPTATPLPVEDTVELPTSGLLDYLATANANLSSAPADLRKGNGAILPGTDGSDLFGYSKWLLSPNTANEIFGPFGLPVSHVGVAVTLVITLALVYFLIYIAVLIIRFIVWLVTIFLKFIPFMG